MQKRYPLVPTLSVLTAVVATVLVALTPAPGPLGLGFQWQPTMLLAFGLVAGLMFLTFLVQNRVGLYLNAILLMTLIGFLMVFGVHAVALLGVAIFAALVLVNIALIFRLMQRLSVQ